jgi:hypothetical protein
MSSGLDKFNLSTAIKWQDEYNQAVLSLSLYMGVDPDDIEYLAKWIADRTTKNPIQVVNHVLKLFHE